MNFGLRYKSLGCDVRLAFAVGLATFALLCRGDDLALRPSAWVAPEIASGHISVGRVKVVHPVQNLEVGTGVSYRPLGYVWTSVWCQSDLSNAYRDRRRRLLDEIDPMVGCGHEFELAEGYSFDTRVAAQWNCMDGYRGAERRSYDEWQIAETLKTPYLTSWFSMRNFYWPVAKASWCAGLMRTFPVAENWQIGCRAWLDGGGERWNQQRFGYENPQRIRRGINSGSLRLSLTYQVSSWCSVTAGVTGYCVLSRAARDELHDNPSDEAKATYAVASLGLRMAY